MLPRSPKISPAAKSTRRFASLSTISVRFMMTGMPSRKCSPIVRASLYVRGCRVVILVRSAASGAPPRWAASLPSADRLTRPAPAFGLVVVVGVLILIGLVAVLVLLIILDKAEIDSHLVDRAGHLSVLRGPWLAARCEGHYLTNAGRSPSNAVPTRTCVAPARMTSSTSPIIHD